MSITFKEFSDILEKSVKSGAQKARSSTGGQKGGGGEGKFKSTTAKAPTSAGGKETVGKIEKGITLGFGKKGKKSTKPKKDDKKDKKDKKDDKKGVDGKPIDTTRDDDGTKKGDLAIICKFILGREPIK